jgi:hypothetical protein
MTSHDPERLATPALSPPDEAAKSCGPTTVPEPLNVADGVKESISQWPLIFLVSPVNSMASVFRLLDSMSNWKPTSFGEAKSSVHS